MLVIIFRIIFIISGAIGAIEAGNFISRTETGEDLGLLPYGLFFIIFVGLGYVAGGVLGRSITSIVKNLVASISKRSASEIVGGALGLIVGLVIAVLVTLPVLRIEYIGTYLSILIFVIFGYFGLLIAVSKSSDMSFLKGLSKSQSGISTDSKIIDTSAIIDGRILDIVKTGFLEGTIILPRFVIHELHAIADSDDDLKRARARKGIDMLKDLQQTSFVEVTIEESDYPGLQQVDLKLVKMAKEKSAWLITNDYNLNKIAQLENIRILNVNELSNAVKPVMYPGERLKTKIIKEGKERSQGISYLDDGTMIVIEDTKDKIGQEVELVVTSVIQTQAGRMVFGKLSDSGEDS